LIKLTNLDYSIDGKIILDSINLEFCKGETFVILGPSGCGKSTLLRLIIGLIKPSGGTIEIDGINTINYTVKDWRQIRQKMGMVFQSAALFDSLTIFDNVAFGLRRSGLNEAAITERVYQTLNLVGLPEDIATKMPADLSGGMKKRTAIARAVALEPPILLYDEPTTGLDPIIADTINELIKDLQLKLKITSIVVTHDIISALQIANRVGLLYQGKLVEIVDRNELSQAKHPLLKQFLHNYQLAI
jgi:phospholipid/cholesterol/gamma-HCH transport system ATP-binding protein